MIMKWYEIVTKCTDPICIADHSLLPPLSFLHYYYMKNIHTGIKVSI